MVKRKRDSIPALVLEVIARVYEVAERRTQPWYIDRAALGLGRPTDSVDSSVYHAEVSGWLVGARGTIIVRVECTLSSPVIMIQRAGRF
jgi:hypothetical protein